MSVWECRPASLGALGDFLRGTKDCSSGDFPPFDLCRRKLFTWGPGSLGEELGEGRGLAVERGHYLLLQVVYNPGTGFLEDESGLELHYSRRKGLEPLGRLQVSLVTRSCS